MPENSLHHVIIGGILIGLAVDLLFLGNGRIAGIGGPLHFIYGRGNSEYRYLSACV